MRFLFAALAAVPLIASGCSNGNFSREDSHYRGPLMYMGAQFNLYASGYPIWQDLDGDGLNEVFYVGGDAEDFDAGPGLYAGRGARGELIPPQTLVARTVACNPAAADFNNDGLVDLAVLVPVPGRGSSGYDLEIFYCSADGSFDPGGPLGFAQIGGNSGVIAAGDFDGNGRPDLVFSSFESSGLLMLLNLGDGKFAGSQVAGSGGFWNDVSAEDLNNDGFADIQHWTTYPQVDPLVTLISNGDGTFQGPRIVVPGDRAAIQPPLDFNGDGFLDILAVPGSGVPQGLPVEVFLGDGAASYTAVKTTIMPTQEVGGPFRPVAAGDFDEDGTPDILVVRTAYNDAGIEYEFTHAPGIGDGTFSTQFGPIYTTARLVHGTVDLQGDGHLDVLGSGAGPGLIRVYFGNGDGTFDPEHYPESENFFGFVTHPGDRFRAPDLDRDGCDDAVTFEESGEIAIRYGRRNGGFDTAILSSHSVARHGFRHYLGDLDGDGDLDLFAPSSSDERLTIYRNDGHRVMVPILPSDTSVQLVGDPVAVRDLDGDSRPDILCQVWNGAVVLYGSEGLAFDTSVFVQMNTVNASDWVSAGDVNGDGSADVFGGVVSGGNPAAILLRVRPGLGAPDSGFHVVQTFPLSPNDLSVSCKAVDLDLDGDVDVLCEFESETSTSDPTPTRALSLRSDGTGGFSQAGYRRSYFGRSWPFYLADVSADGRPDLIQANRDVGLSVSLGEGDGTFGTANYFETPTLIDVLFGDFNGDSDGDIFATTLESPTLIENRLVGR